MGTSALLTFGILKNFKISHFHVSKNYIIKYIDRYIHEEHMQKNSAKKYVVF
jgi:hypothetical protein